MVDRGVSRRQWLAWAGTATAVGVAGCGGNARKAGTDGAEPTTSATPIHAAYDTTRVRVESEGSGVLGAVTAAIADTPELRYTGLSATESLPDDRGMLFVYDEVSDHTYVMRGMAFSLDIVYAGSDGTITRIHHAPAPGPGEDGEDQRYPGDGQYVLEVNMGWTTERGVTVGDRLVID
jgi:uncharacterized membrane protein (UPF0127 family)